MADSITHRLSFAVCFNDHFSGAPVPDELPVRLAGSLQRPARRADGRGAQQYAWREPGAGGGIVESLFAITVDSGAAPGRSIDAQHEPATGSCVRSHVTVALFCERFHDSEPQPAAAVVSSTAGIESHEALEHVANLVSGDAGAVVRHLKHDPAAFAGADQVNCARRMLDRVRQQVPDSTTQRPCVSLCRDPTRGAHGDALPEARGSDDLVIHSVWHDQAHGT